MMDLAVLALILSFIIGLISSALLTAALYLFQLSRKSAPATTTESGISARTKAVDAVATKAADSTALKLKVLPKTSSGGDGDAAVKLKESTDEDGSTATTSYSSCERCSVGQIPVNSHQQKHRQQQQQVFSCWTDDAATETAGSAGLYTCEVCGFCCAGDNQKPGKTYRPLDSASIDAELSIESSLVRFRRCRTGVGAYFFHRNNDNEASLTAVSAVSTNLTLPAVSDCLYNLRFCTTNGESHSSSLTQCSDCRLVLCFELTNLSDSNASHEEPVVFLNRLKQGGDENIGKLCVDEIDSWLVAVLSDSAAKETNIVYSGMAHKLVQIAKHPHHRLVLQLCLQGQQTQCLEPNSIVQQDCDALNPDQATHGNNQDLASPLTTEQLLMKQQQQKQRQLRRKRRRMLQRQRGETAAGSDVNNCEEREVWDGGDSECSNSAGNSLQGDTKSSLTGNQSPLSMGSMRRAVRWPITQMESLMETSSSSTSSAAASGPSSPIGGRGGRGDVCIRLEEDDPQPSAPGDNEAEAQHPEERQGTLD